MNELSLKQHHRQYSGENYFFINDLFSIYFLKGLHRLNAFHSRSSSVEPQQQQTNVTVLNDCENVSEISKEEEILERSRQMLEESKVKNEQLAEQVRFFLFLSFFFFVFFKKIQKFTFSCSKRQKYFNEHYKEMKSIQH